MVGVRWRVRMCRISRNVSFEHIYLFSNMNIFFFLFPLSLPFSVSLLRISGYIYNRALRQLHAIHVQGGEQFAR